MTVYGDLDVSVIDERHPVASLSKLCIDMTRNVATYIEFIRKELNNGKQAYIVYPLIERAKTLDFEKLGRIGYQHVSEAFPEFKVVKMHGRMKPAEKDEVMQQFVAKKRT